VMIVQRRELKDQQKSRSLATIDTNNPYRIKPQLRRGRAVPAVLVAVVAALLAVLVVPVVAVLTRPVTVAPAVIARPVTPVPAVLAPAVLAIV
jgi:hypothetical protein